MLDFAKYRKAHYQTKHDVQLALEYEQANLFKFAPSEPYDAVYSSATLHHIEPAAGAIAAVSHLIKPGGYFFLSDENGLSPLQQMLIYRKRGWTGPRKYWRVDEETGERYLYGNENIRAAFLRGRYMRAAEMPAQSIKYCRFLPPLDRPVEWFVKWERMLRRIPVLAELGAIGFLMTARKVSQ